ncbi:MAG TPA: hypothetical protein VHZ07_11530 [Bryobacteraceae bacterium]|jgi:hypothetical protein|nr:hypothetical protein [Bryobacteraceae bacterium]
MTLDAFLRYASIWTLILGILSLAFAVRNYRRQVNAQIFFEIARRYHEMLQSLPVREWSLQLRSSRELPEVTPELTASVFRYLAIVHFAFVLHELRYLSRDLWRILQAEHHRTLTTPLFRREWVTVRFDFDLFSKFQSYVDGLQGGAIDPVTTPLFGLGTIAPFLRRMPPSGDRPNSLPRQTGGEFPS